MKRLLALLLLAMPIYAATPFAAVKKAFTGESGWVISIGAFGAAEACDYKSTVTTVDSGAGYELNPLLTTSTNNLDQGRLIAAKAIVFGDAFGSELFLWHKMNAPQRAKFGKWFIVGNWVAATVVGGVAAHNREIYERVVR